MTDSIAEVDETEARSRKDWYDLLDQVADECLDAADGQIKLAAEAMQLRVRQDPLLQQAIIEILVVQACTDHVRKRLRHRNARVWRANQDGFHSGDRLRRASRLSRSLMDYHLRGGIKLGQATREVVRENAEMQDRQSRRMAKTALWFAMIAAEMQPGQVVEEVFTEAQLAEMHARVLRSNSVLIGSMSDVE